MVEEGDKEVILGDMRHETHHITSWDSRKDLTALPP